MFKIHPTDPRNSQEMLITPVIMSLAIIYHYLLMIFRDGEWNKILQCGTPQL